MAKKLTIHDIKYLLGNSTHYFDRKTLQFFGQTLKDFTVTKLDETHYFLRAPLRMGENYCYGQDEKGRKFLMYSEKIYNVTTNKLESVG